MDESSERWLPVPGYEGLYSVSDQGRVRSEDRVIQQRTRSGRPGTRFAKGRVLKTPLDKDGYVTAALVHRSQVKLRKVHALVLEAFIGPRPDGLVACHGDGNPLNNAPGNLRWDSVSANTEDKVRHGRHPMLNRDACPREHPLRAPNLVPNPKRPHYRGCLSCQLTHSWARKYGYAPQDPEWRQEADRRYAEILHFGEPIRYSRAGRDTRWLPSV